MKRRAYRVTMHLENAPMKGLFYDYVVKGEDDKLDSAELKEQYRRQALGDLRHWFDSQNIDYKVIHVEVTEYCNGEKVE